jgi:curved DNA-binding protein CbpA
LARTILGFDPAQVLTKEAINDRRKQLAKVFHPDRPAGSLEAMKRVNLAADLLLAQLAKPG